MGEDCDRSNARIAAVTASSTPSTPTFLTTRLDQSSAIGRQMIVVASIKANNRPSAFERSRVAVIVTTKIARAAIYWITPRIPAPVSMAMLPTTA